MTHGVIWSALTKLPDAPAFRTVVMAAVAVVTTPFFTAIIITTRQVVRAGSQSDVVLILPIGLRHIRFWEITDVAIFDLIGDGQAE